MDIEQLSKSQIVLLTLLISFMTSIATGIVTVSLMDQAPPAVAQSVSRIIEKTIQTVASTTPRGQAAATVVTQEKTVVIRESDLISQAVKNASPSVVRLYTGGGEGEGTFAGIGIVLDAAGTVATDAGALGDAADATLTLADGSRVRAFVVSRDASSGVAYLRSATSTTSGAPTVFSPIGISAEQPVLGQTVVLLSGKSAPRIAAGLITAIVPSADVMPQLVQTDVASDTIVPGSPLIDTGGSLIGISTSVARANSGSGFVSGTALMASHASGHQ